MEKETYTLKIKTPPHKESYIKTVKIINEQTKTVNQESRPTFLSHQSSQALTHLFIISSPLPASAQTCKKTSSSAPFHLDCRQGSTIFSTVSTKKSRRSRVLLRAQPMLMMALEQTLKLFSTSVHMRSGILPRKWLRVILE